MKIILETLSPIHIGSGDRYSSSEFIIKGNKIIRSDINKIYSLLNEKNKEAFLEYLENPTFKLNDFINRFNIPTLEGKLYDINLKTDIPFEIIENIKTGFKGYIPGSTLKGAIRTAILSAFIGEEEVKEIGKIFEIKNPWQRDREAERFLANFLFTGVRQSTSSDFMRFIQISDFKPVNNLCVYNIQSLEAEINNWRWYQRNGRIIQSYLETITVGEHLEGEIHINYNHKMYYSLRLKGKEDILDISEIKRLIHLFSDGIIDHEIAFSNRYGIKFLEDFYTNLKKINKKESPLIKLGQGSGYLATTIGLEIKKYPEVYERVRMSLRGKSYSYEFPKTRKIIVEEKMPLGWCKIL